VLAYLLQLLPSPSNQTLYQSATEEKRDQQMEKEGSSKGKKKKEILRNNKEL